MTCSGMAGNSCPRSITSSLTDFGCVVHGTVCPFVRAKGGLLSFSNLGHGLAERLVGFLVAQGQGVRSCQINPSVDEERMRRAGRERLETSGQKHGPGSFVVSSPGEHLSLVDGWHHDL